MAKRIARQRCSDCGIPIRHGFPDRHFLYCNFCALKRHLVGPPTMVGKEKEMPKWFKKEGRT